MRPAKGRYWRRAKRARSQALSCRPPPPPANWNWRSGSYFPRKTHVLGPSRCHLAERVTRQHLTKTGLLALRHAQQLAPGLGAVAIRLASVFANYSALAKFSHLLMTCQFISCVDPPATLPFCHALGNDAIVAKPGQPRSTGGKCLTLRHGSSLFLVSYAGNCNNGLVADLFRCKEYSHGSNEA